MAQLDLNGPYLPFGHDQCCVAGSPEADVRLGPLPRREAAFTEAARLVRHSRFLESVSGFSLQLGVADHTCHHSNMTKTRCLKKLVSHCTFLLDVKSRHVTSSVACSANVFVKGTASNDPRTPIAF